MINCYLKFCVRAMANYQYLGSYLKVFRCGESIHWLDFHGKELEVILSKGCSSRSVPSKKVRAQSTANLELAMNSRYERRPASWLRILSFFAIQPLKRKFITNSFFRNYFSRKRSSFSIGICGVRIKFKFTLKSLYLIILIH